jgi:hypothetical protein
VVHDERDVVREQAQIEVVHHCARCGNAEVALEMRIVVPHQRGHAVAGLDACLHQHLGERLGAAVEVCVGVAVQRLVRQARDDLAFTVINPGALQKMVERQGHLHHGRGDAGLLHFYLSPMD